MKKGWTTTKLIAIGALSVLRFLVRIFLYTTLLVSTGSIFAGISTLVIWPFFVILTALSIKKFGSVALFSFLSVLIDLPTPSVFPKIVNLIQAPLTGLIIDGFFSLHQINKKLVSFITGFIYNFIQVLLTIILYFLIGLPGTRNLPNFLLTPSGLILVCLLISTIGGFTGYFSFLVYQKLKNTAVVKRIQGA